MHAEMNFFAIIVSKMEPEYLMFGSVYEPEFPHTHLFSSYLYGSVKERMHCNYKFLL